MPVKELYLDFDRPLAHRADPQTSYDAADKVVKSGELNRQERIVMDAIARHSQPEGITAKELSAKSGIDYFTIQRRLSGLEGRIEFLTVDGRWVLRLDENNRPFVKNGCRVIRHRKADEFMVRK